MEVPSSANATVQIDADTSRTWSFWHSGTSRRPRTRTIAALTAVVGFIAIGASGCNSNTGGALGGPATVPPPTSIASAAETPGASTPASSDPSASITPAEVPTDEHFIQSHTIEQMDSMSIEQFALLSYGDRLAYAIAKESNFPVDNAQQAVDTHSNPSIIPGIFWQGILGLAINGPDPNERAKVLGAMYYYTSDVNTGTISDAYKSNADVAINYGGDGLGSSNGYKFVESGQWQEMTDEAGTKIDYIDITYDPIDSHTGASKGSEQTAQAIRAQVKLLDGSVVTCYPMGYSTSGHASPVSGRGY